MRRTASPPRTRTWQQRAGWISVLILLIPLAGLAFETVAAALDARRYAPPGEMIDVGGYSLHLDCHGTGTPVVILDAGMGDNTLHWSRVQPGVAAFTRVCAYDRAGLGWSDPGPRPRTASRIADELRLLLARADIAGPFVLVGHSFGAFTARIFADRHADAAAGLVLVDAADPQWWVSSQGRADAVSNAQERRRQAWLARFGLVRLYGELIRLDVVAPPPAIAGFLDSMPADVDGAQISHWSRVPYYEAVASQWESMAESSAAVLAAGDAGDLPLVVITAASNQTAAQRDMAELSTNGVQMIALRSGHDVHIEQPEIVVRAIRDVVERLRKR